MGWGNALYLDGRYESKFAKLQLTKKSTAKPEKYRQLASLSHRYGPTQMLKSNYVDASASLFAVCLLALFAAALDFPNSPKNQSFGTIFAYYHLHAKKNWLKKIFLA